MGTDLALRKAIVGFEYMDSASKEVANRNPVDSFAAERDSAERIAESQ